MANFFLGLVGGAQLTPPQNTLMDGVAAVLAVLGLGVAVWLYGAVRNSAARYVWLMPTAMIILPAKSFAAVCAAADWPSWA